MKEVPKKRKPMVSRPIRFDPDELKQANKSQIDINAVCRGALNDAIHRAIALNEKGKAK